MEVRQAAASPLAGSASEHDDIAPDHRHDRFRLEARCDRVHGRQFDLAGYRAAGTTTISVGDGDVDGDVDPLRGALVDVVDSLVGRGPELTEVLHGPPKRVQRLGMLRAFTLLPVS